MFPHCCVNLMVKCQEIAPCILSLYIYIHIIYVYIHIYVNIILRLSYPVCMTTTLSVSDGDIPYSPVISHAATSTPFVIWVCLIIGLVYHLFSYKHSHLWVVYPIFRQNHMTLHLIKLVIVNSMISCNISPLSNDIIMV